MGDYILKELASLKNELFGNKFPTLETSSI